jgi:hypothetical protein
MKKSFFIFVLFTVVSKVLAAGCCGVTRNYYDAPASKLGTYTKK